MLYYYGENGPYCSNYKWSFRLINKALKTPSSKPSSGLVYDAITVYVTGDTNMFYYHPELRPRSCQVSYTYIYPLYLFLKTVVVIGDTDGFVFLFSATCFCSYRMRSYCQSPAQTLLDKHVLSCDTSYSIFCWTRGTTVLIFGWRSIGFHKIFIQFLV